MEVKIKKLKLTNFKGIRELSIDFSDTTTIAGANATGKSTIFDAFTWLLFGKDSSDRKDFNIKTLNPDGTAMSRIDHSVEGVLEVNGSASVYKRTFREKWTKRRGEADVVFDGHESVFEIDSVPMTMKDYQDTIDTLIPETLFKLLTNPYYFNSLPWQSRRDLIFEVAGNVTEMEIMADNPKKFGVLSEWIEQGKEIDDMRRIIGAAIKNLKEELKQYEARIDEASRGTVTENLIPEEQCRKRMSEIDKEIDKLDRQIADRYHARDVASEEARRIKDELVKIQTKMDDLERDAAKQWREKAHDIEQQKEQAMADKRIMVTKHDGVVAEIKAKKERYVLLTKEVQDLRAKYIELKDQNFIPEEGMTVCPMCKRELDNAEELTSHRIEEFNASKAAKLKEIGEKGARMAAELKDTEAQAKKLIEEEKELAKQMDSKADEIGVLKDMHTTIIGKVSKVDPVKKQELDELKAIEMMKLEKAQVPDVDVTDLNERKEQIKEEFRKLAHDASQWENVNKAETRVKELVEEEKTKAQELADWERRGFLVDEMMKVKVEMIQDKVAEKFPGVSFRMFNKLVNGGQEPACETLIDGVPFRDANHAAQINTGIVIINAMSEHYETTAPIFVDNAEAVNKLTETSSQMIRLVVSDHKKLEVTND